MNSHTAIQPIMFGDSASALAASDALLARGLLVTAIRPPTVASARLRITLSAAHSEAQVDQLLQALAELKITRASS